MAEALGIKVGWSPIDTEDQVVPMSALAAALFYGPKPPADLGARPGPPHLPAEVLARSSRPAERADAVNPEERRSGIDPSVVLTCAVVDGGADERGPDRVVCAGDSRRRRQPSKTTVG